MAVPKRKVSKQSGNSRFANWKLSSPNLVKCSQCHELINSHTVCPSCGYYNGKAVVVMKTKEEK
ncbi:MAG: 50S ribosomal protein L32 [Christensenellaceae bacterium]|nr:50S ribosomal protein L32 [Christensenellaceae bacterium]